MQVLVGTVGPGGLCTVRIRAAHHASALVVSGEGLYAIGGDALQLVAVGVIKDLCQRYAGRPKSVRIHLGGGNDAVHRVVGELRHAAQLVGDGQRVARGVVRIGTG